MILDRQAISDGYNNMFADDACYIQLVRAQGKYKCHYLNINNIAPVMES